MFIVLEQEQEKGRHEPRFLAYVVMKVKPLRADGLLANHRTIVPAESTREWQPS